MSGGCCHYWPAKVPKRDSVTNEAYLPSKSIMAETMVTPESGRNASTAAILPCPPWSRLGFVCLCCAGILLRRYTCSKYQTVEKYRRDICADISADCQYTGSGCRYTAAGIPALPIFADIWRYFPVYRRPYFRTAGIPPDILNINDI